MVRDLPVIRDPPTEFLPEGVGKAEHRTAREGGFERGAKIEGAEHPWEREGVQPSGFGGEHCVEREIEP